MNVQSFQLMSEKEWGKLFSRTEYDKTKSKDTSLSPEKTTLIRNHSLKYLIAFNEPIEKIIQLIKTLQMKNSPQLSSSFTNYQFTSLIIAVMKDQPQVVQALIETKPFGSPERKALLEARDCYGWTALHHAALKSNEQMLNLLFAAGAEAESKTSLGATYEHLRMMAGLKSAAQSYERLDYCPLGGVAKHVAIEQFQNFTGLQKYSEQPIYPLSRIKLLWQAVSQKLELEPTVEFVHKLYHNIYQKMLENLPRLVVKEERSQSFGLYAGQDLKFIQGVIEYVGEVAGEGYAAFKESLSAQDSAYQLMDLDAARVGNASRFANEGFPNAGFLPVFNLAGRVTRNVLVVLDPMGIKKDEAIYWDYSVGEVKLKWNIPYRLGRREAMHGYFKENSLDQLLEEAQREEMNQEALISQLCIEAKIKYVYSTPAALIDLVCHHMIQPRKLKEFLCLNLLDDLRQCSSTHMNWISQLIDLMQNLNVLLEPIQGDLKQEIFDFISGNLGKITTIQVIHGIQLIEQWLKDSHDSSSERDLASSWAELKESLTKSLPLYQEYPFSLGEPGIFQSDKCTIS